MKGCILICFFSSNVRLIVQKEKVVFTVGPTGAIRSNKTQKKLHEGRETSVEQAQRKNSGYLESCGVL